MVNKKITTNVLVAIFAVAVALPEVNAQQSVHSSEENGSVRAEMQHSNNGEYESPNENLYVAEVEESDTTSHINSERERYVQMPYSTFDAYNRNRTVSAISTISGDELVSYPGANFLESLRGRIPGLVISQGNTMPGFESSGVSVRGTGVMVFIDGVRRDPALLTAYEVDQVQVIKDFSGRALMGVSSPDPVLWITTKRGQPNGQINVSAEYGIHSPTVLPDYLDAFNHATLINEAMVNDGNDPIYSEADLDAYRSQSNPLLYPDVDYYDRYVNDISSFRRVNVDFSNATNNVRYFAMVNYTGGTGLEKVGQTIKNDRFRARGKISFPVNDWIDVDVNVLGTYQAQTFPNFDNTSTAYNMFDNVLSTYPANASPMMHDNRFIVSDDYPINLDNNLSLRSGRGEISRISSHNDGIISMNLNRFVQGLRFKSMITFDIDNDIGIGRGGTNPLYRVTSAGELERVQEEVVDPNMGLRNNSQAIRTQGIVQLNYDMPLNEDHSLLLDGAFFRSYFDGSWSFQPEHFMDLSFRANYSYLQRYVVQLDVAHSGSMRLPGGERFNTYPTVGAAWIASNEGFLRNSETFNYLKFYSSYGVTGVSNFFTPTGDMHYLYRTSWNNPGSWGLGVEGNRGSSPVISLSQIGNPNLDLPEREYFNVGVQGEAFNNHISYEVNYYEEKNTGLLTTMTNVTPSILGGNEFNPVQNYESNKKWGFDGMVGFSGNVGELGFNVGANALYTRGKYLQVDEAPSLADYRKRAGTNMDSFWMYQADGLFQNEAEIDAHVPQSWGTVQPGDVRYLDFNGDGVINEQDVHNTGNHSPRLFYGVNLSLNYRGLNLFVQGNGVADGQVILENNRYFRIGGVNQKYSAPMLDRWPETNSFPRLTTSSANNTQNSTFWVRNANYFRISSMELSYTMSQLFSQNDSNKSWTVFLRGTNLLTVSGLNDYSIDPTNLNAGINMYPVLRTVTAGLSLKL